MIQVFSVKESDIDALNALHLKLVSETGFLLRTPEEMKAQVESGSEQERILQSIDAHNCEYFIAKDGDNVVGFIKSWRGLLSRNQHAARFAIGILQSHTGQGIGRLLIEALEEKLRPQGVARLDLTVMTHNENATALYQKLGFEIEGTMRKSMRVNGEFVDEYLMSKVF